MSDEEQQPGRRRRDRAPAAAQQPLAYGEAAEEGAGPRGTQGFPRETSGIPGR